MEQKRREGKQRFKGRGAGTPLYTCIYIHIHMHMYIYNIYTLDFFNKNNNNWPLQSVSWINSNDGSYGLEDSIWGLELIHETQCNGQLLLFLSKKSKVYKLLCSQHWALYLRVVATHILFSIIYIIYTYNINIYNIYTHVGYWWL